MIRASYLTFLILAFGIVWHPTFAQQPEVALTNNAKVSLLTCSQGEELYSIFGHSAIRVVDSDLGIDWVFNYGTFDFSDPNFYPNFVKGKLNYILSVSSYKNFESTYIYEGRFIYEQILNLHQNEKQKLLDSLRINYLPQNRYYLYDFLFDNCATRIRDIFVKTIPRTISFDYSALEQGKSFRLLLMPNVKETPWAKLGINLLLGVKADRPALPWEYMFLPEHMMTAFQFAGFYEGIDTSPFAQEPEIILAGNEIPVNKFRNSPLYVFILILLLSLLVTFINIKKQKYCWWFDRTLFGLVGLLGFVIAFQWFGSDHNVMAWNYNLIWAHPLHFLAVFIISSSQFARIKKIYFGINMLLMILLIAFWFILPQTLPIPMLPLVGAIAIRSAIIFKKTI